MPSTTSSPLPALGGPALALAAAGPVAIGALLATRDHALAPLILVPAVVFGVTAATSPALYIASAATGTAPPLGRMLRALATALGAFGVALAGLLLPAVFLALSSSSPVTTVLVASAALGAAAVLGMRRLAHELAPAAGPPTFTASVVFVTWSATTLGLAGQLWWDLAGGVS